MPVFDFAEPTNDEELGSGEVCARCGTALLISEGQHCGPRHGDTLNCSATVACELITREGVQSYRTQMAQQQAPPDDTLL